jgi:pilus assembly protein Flp/PilA
MQVQARWLLKYLAETVSGQGRTRLAKRRYIEMRNLMLKVHFKLGDLIAGEEGQDLVEYALVVALIAFGAVTAMQGLSTEINTAFNVISSDLATSL